MATKTRYTMVSKSGEELYHSDSFLGFIGTTFLVNILSFFVITIIALIVTGIASLFG